MSDGTVYLAGEEPLHWIRPDLAGTVIDGEHATLVRWAVPAGKPPTPMHAHAEYEQICTVLSGSIETTVGDTVYTLKAGDICQIRRGVQHGRTTALGGTDAVVLDVFTPPRQHYIEAARRETTSDR